MKLCWMLVVVFVFPLFKTILHGYLIFDVTQYRLPLLTNLLSPLYYIHEITTLLLSQKLKFVLYICRTV